MQRQRVSGFQRSSIRRRTAFQAARRCMDLSFAVALILSRKQCSDLPNQHACMIQGNADRPVCAHCSHCAHSSRRRRWPAMHYRRVLRDRIRCRHWFGMHPGAICLRETLDVHGGQKRDLRGHGARDGSSRQEFHRRTKLSTNRERQQDARALHNFSRHETREYDDRSATATTS